MEGARRPAWFLPLAVLTLDAVLLFGAVGVGLAIPGLRLLGGAGHSSGLDYSTLLIAGLPPLRAQYLAEELGIPVPGRPASQAGVATPVQAGSPIAADEAPVLDPHALTNDDFERARSVAMGQGGYYAQGTTQGARRQPGEPQASCDAKVGGGTIWYRYLAERSTTYVVSTRGARYWVVLAAYGGGPAFGDLQEVACDEDPQGNTYLELPAKAGRTYFFQVGAPLERGTLEFSVTPLLEGQTERASLSSRGTQGDDWSALPALSGDGRLLAFTSAASNLVPEDSNVCPFVAGLHNYRYPYHAGGRSCPDVFVRDQATGETTLISRGMDGPADAASWAPAISPDGRWLAFSSMATNLLPSPKVLCPPHNMDPTAYACSNIFLWDRTTGRLEVVSVSASGEPALGWSDHPSVSADGRFIVFVSTARNLAPGNEDGTMRTFIRDRRLGTTRVVSFSFHGTPSGVFTHHPQISANGRYVAFGADYDPPRPGAGLPSEEAYVHDLTTGRTVRLSNSYRGGPADGTSDYPVISRTGRHVAFLSSATDIDGSDPGQGGAPNSPPVCYGETRLVTRYGVCYDVFVRDRDPDRDGFFDEPGAVTTIRVSVTSSGQRTDGGTYNPAISADGRFVTFSSWQNLDQAYDAGVLERIFVHDRDADRDGIFDEPGAVWTRAVSVSSSGEAANDRSGEPVLSADGRVVAFFSDATNLVGSDDNMVADIFIHTRWWR